MCGGHNQVGEGDVTFRTGTVVMKQRAARCFNDTDTLADPRASGCDDQVLLLQIGIAQQLVDQFRGMEDSMVRAQLVCNVMLFVAPLV